MTLVRGIDVSRYQTVTSWPAVKSAGVGFVIVKATEGVTSVSSTWRRYFAGARQAGLLTGSYHFAHPKNDPKREAAHYVDELRAVGWKSGRDLPPILDIEAVEGKTRQGLTDWCLAFVREVDRLLGLDQPWLRTGFYSNFDYYNTRMFGAQLHAGRWWMVASWPNPSGPWPTADDRVPSPAAIWQWTDRVRVAGIRENADGDVARLVELRQLAPIYYGANVAPVEEDPLAGITLDQISAAVRAVVRSEVRYDVEPGDGAKRISGGFPPDLANGASVGAWAVDVASQVRAIARALDALADGMEPAVRDAVRAALADAVVSVDVNVNTPKGEG